VAAVFVAGPYAQACAETTAAKINKIAFI
jgi:hypothetical protein